MSKLYGILAGAIDYKVLVHLPKGSQAVFQVDPDKYQTVLSRISNYSNRFDAKTRFTRFECASKAGEKATFMVVLVEKTGRDRTLRGRAYGSANDADRVFTGTINGTTYAVAASSLRKAAAALGVTYHVARTRLTPSTSPKVRTAALAAEGQPIEL